MALLLVLGEYRSWLRLRWQTKGRESKCGIGCLVWGLEGELEKWSC